VNVFPQSLERVEWDLRAQNMLLVNESGDALAQLSARSSLLNTLVQYKSLISSQHANTVVICTDMLSILETLGECDPFSQVDANLHSPFERSIAILGI
jgi:hypothetical protein